MYPETQYAESTVSRYGIRTRDHAAERIFRSSSPQIYTKILYLFGISTTSLGKLKRKSPSQCHLNNPTASCLCRILTPGGSPMTQSLERVVNTCNWRHSLLMAMLFRPRSPSVVIRIEPKGIQYASLRILATKALPLGVTTLHTWANPR